MYKRSNKNSISFVILVEFLTINYCFELVNLTISLGVQFSILHSFSRVKSVILLFFFRESRVLLSMPCLISWY